MIVQLPDADALQRDTPNELFKRPTICTHILGIGVGTGPPAVFIPFVYGNRHGTNRDPGDPRTVWAPYLPTGNATLCVPHRIH